MKVCAAKTERLTPARLNDLSEVFHSRASVSKERGEESQSMHGLGLVRLWLAAVIDDIG